MSNLKIKYASIVYDFLVDRLIVAGTWETKEKATEIANDRLLCLENIPYEFANQGRYKVYILKLK